MKKREDRIREKIDNQRRAKDLTIDVLIYSKFRSNEISYTPKTNINGYEINLMYMKFILQEKLR